MKSASSNLLTCNVSSENKETSNLGPKIPYLGIFWLQFNKICCQIFNQYSWSRSKKLGIKYAVLRLWAGMFKNYYHICNQHPPICLIAKFRASLKFGTTNALFGCFGEQFWNTTVIFPISALKFVLQKSLVQEQKSSTLEPKISNLGVFGLKF